MTGIQQPRQAKALAASAPTAADQSLVALIEAQQRPLWRYLRLLGADAHEADDLMQDTFVQFASTKRDNLQSPVAFLRGIARNLLLAARRRQRRDVPNAHWLHHVEGLSRQQTAAQLGIGDEGVKSLLSRTRDLLRQCVEQRTETVEPS